MDKKDLADMLLSLDRRLRWGCGNHGCVIRTPAVGTNGMCRCTPRDFARGLREYAEMLDRIYDNPEHSHGRRW